MDIPRKPTANHKKIQTHYALKGRSGSLFPSAFAGSAASKALAYTQSIRVLPLKILLLQGEFLWDLSVITQFRNLKKAIHMLM